MARKRTIEFVNWREKLDKLLQICHYFLDTTGEVPYDIYQRTVRALRNYAKWQGWRSRKYPTHNYGLYNLCFYSLEGWKTCMELLDTDEYPVLRRYIDSLESMYKYLKEWWA